MKKLAKTMEERILAAEAELARLRAREVYLREKPQLLKAREMARSAYNAAIRPYHRRIQDARFVAAKLTRQQKDGHRVRSLLEKKFFEARIDPLDHAWRYSESGEVVCQTCSAMLSNELTSADAFFLRTIGPCDQLNRIRGRLMGRPWNVPPTTTEDHNG